MFAILIFFINRYVVYSLDSDAAGEMVLAKVLAERAALITTDWHYGNELRVLQNHLFTAPLFMLFDDWHTVRVLGTSIMLVLFVLSIFIFCSEMELRKYFPIIAMILLLPISRCYFNNVLKFSYYVVYITLNFLIPAAMIHYARTKAGMDKKRMAFFVLCLILAFAAGLSGYRMIFTLFIPLILAVLLFGFINDWKSRPEAGKMLAWLSAVSAAAVGGMLINSEIFTNIYWFRDYGVVRHFTRFSIQAMESVIAGMIDIFGYQAGAELVSRGTFFCAFAGAIFALSIYSVVFVLQHRDKFSSAQQIAVYYYLAAFVTMLLLAGFTDMFFDYRYFLQLSVLAFPPIMIFLGYRPSKDRDYGKYFIFAIAAVYLLSGALLYNDMRKEDSTKSQRLIAQFLVEEGYTEGYATFWNSHILTELSDGKIDVWSWHAGAPAYDSPDDLYLSLQRKEHYERHPRGKMFVLIKETDARYEEAFEILGKENVIFQTENYSFKDNNVYEYTVFGFESYDVFKEQIGQQGQ